MTFTRRRHDLIHAGTIADVDVDGSITAYVNGTRDMTATGTAFMSCVNSVMNETSGSVKQKYFKVYSNS